MIMFMREEEDTVSLVCHGVTRLVGERFCQRNACVSNLSQIPLHTKKNGSFTTNSRAVHTPLLVQLTT